MGLETAALLMGTTQALGAASNIFAIRGQAEAEKALLDINRNIAERAAVDAIARGDLEAAAVRRRAKAVIGLQQARAAAAGVDPFTGTAAALQEETGVLSDFDRMMIRISAAREAYGYRTQALEASLRRRMVTIEARARTAQEIAGAAEDLARTGSAYAYYRGRPPSTQGAEQILSAYPLF